MDLSNKRLHTYTESIKKLLAPYESKVHLFQRILLWETPLHSSIFTVALITLIWFISQQRVYFVCGIIGFFYCTWRLCTVHIWPEIRVPLPAGMDTEGWTSVHPDILGVPELSHQLAILCVQADNTFEYAYNLRKKEPGKFFIFVSMILSATAFVGHYVSGVNLIYLLVIGGMTLPSLYWNNILARIDRAVQPLVKNLEDTMHIKRKASKKVSSQGLAAGVDADSSDEELQQFVPENVSLLTLKMNVSNIDDDHTGFTPNLKSHQKMPEVTPSHDISDDDSTYADLPSQMPSVMLDDSQSLDFMPQYSDTDFDITDSLTSRSLANVNNHSIAPFDDVSDDNATAEPFNRGQGHELDSDPDTTLNDQSSIVSMTSPIPQHLLLDEPLDFRHEHFRQFSDDDDTEDTSYGLGLPDDDDVTTPTVDQSGTTGVLAGALGLITSMTTGNSGAGDDNVPVGARLAGALQSAQGSVLQAGGDMVASLMQQTVAGLSDRLGGGAAASAASDAQPAPPTPRHDDATGESDEFVILDSDDFYDVSKAD